MWVYDIDSDEYAGASTSWRTGQAVEEGRPPVGGLRSGTTPTAAGPEGDSGMKIHRASRWQRPTTLARVHGRPSPTASRARLPSSACGSRPTRSTVSGVVADVIGRRHAQAPSAPCRAAGPRWCSGRARRPPSRARCATSASTTVPTSVSMRRPTIRSVFTAAGGDPRRLVRSSIRGMAADGRQRTRLGRADPSWHRSGLTLSCRRHQARPAAVPRRSWRHDARPHERTRREEQWPWRRSLSEPRASRCRARVSAAWGCPTSTGRGRRGVDRHHPPRPRARRDLPRHRRHVRPVHQRGARRQGARRAGATRW